MGKRNFALGASPVKVTKINVDLDPTVPLHDGDDVSYSYGYRTNLMNMAL